MRPIPPRSSSTRFATLVVQLGAFVLLLGLPDGATGVLWPSMRQSFHLPLDALGVLSIAGTSLYFSGGLLGNRLQRRLGVGRTTLASCSVALVALLAWSAAPDFLTVLAAVAVLGLSRGVIDAVMNAEAALAGGVRRLGLLHASWGIGGTLGPILVAAVIAGAGDWRLAVVVIAAGVVLLLPVAVVDARRLPRGRVGTPDSGEISAVSEDPGRTTAGAGAIRAGGGTVTDGPAAHSGSPREQRRPGRPSPAPARRLVMALTAAAFVAYTAAEGGTIAWGYSYLILDRRLSHTLAAGALAGFWAALTLGRFGLAARGDRMAGTIILEVSCLIFVAGLGLFWLLPGTLSIVGLPIAGLGSAAVFPMLVALTPLRIGTEGTGSAVGVSIAASAFGGPAAAALFGLAAAHVGVGVLGGCLFGAAVVTYGVNRTLTLVTRSVPS